MTQHIFQMPRQLDRLKCWYEETSTSQNHIITPLPKGITM